MWCPSQGYILVLTLGACLCLSTVLPSPECLAESRQSIPVRVAVDFNDVDLAVFVRFMSELTGKHFVLDEKITGKVTVYSPSKVTTNEMKRDACVYLIS